MEYGLFGLCRSSWIVAAGVGAALGLAATCSGRWVAWWTHRLGLRPDPAGGVGQAVAQGLGLGAVAGALAAAPLGEVGVALCLGVIYGHCATDLANNARAAVMVRALATSGGASEAWSGLPPWVRYSVVRAGLTSLAMTWLVVVLLWPDPALLGFALGSFAHLGWQRLALARAMVRAGAGDRADPSTTA